jgi:hypothetical protein
MSGSRTAGGYRLLLDWLVLTSHASAASVGSRPRNRKPCSARDRRNPRVSAAPETRNAALDERGVAIRRWRTCRA